MTNESAHTLHEAAVAERARARLAAPHHTPTGAMVSDPTPVPGEIVEVILDDPAGTLDEVRLRTVHDGEAAWHDATSERGADGSQRWRAQLPCHNASVNYRFWTRAGSKATWVNGLGVADHDVLDHEDFRLLTTGRTPAWVPETVWYQIFPDRFAASGRHADAVAAAGADWADPVPWDAPIAEGHDAMRQLYGGDLDGIVARLDHLSELGIGGIYLTPIFPARSNHRYDATTWDAVDPILGGDEALIRLRRAAADKGIRLITDLTLNHTGDAHDWFRAAQADASSLEAGFYYFGHHPDEYESWLGVRSLPKLDHASTELRRRLYVGDDSILGRYLRPPFDLDGWRIDVANMTGRLGLVDHNALVRRAARATNDHIDPERWLVAEHFFDATDDAQGAGWHGVMNYAGVARPIVSWLGTADTLASMMPGPGQDARDGRAAALAMDVVRAALPWQVVLGSMALLSSHDTARWRTMARSDTLARVGLGLLLAVPGSPCFFYGDEIGLRGPDMEKSRVPMEWDRDAWDHDTLDWYRSLVRFRSGSSALAHGGFRWVECEPDALTFLREDEDERLLIRATRGPSPALDVPLELLGATELEPVNGSDARRPGTAILDAPAASFGIWRLH